jgi:hypothetical protein
MRCRSCNEALTDYETTIRSVYTRDYLSMCKQCLKSIKTDLVAVGNVSLMSEADETDEGTESDLDPLAGIDGFDDGNDDPWQSR